MRFFFDNNLSEDLTKGMQAFGEDVVHLKDIFPEDTADTVWLDTLVRIAWFLLLGMRRFAGILRKL